MSISEASHMPTGSFGHSRRPPRGYMRSNNRPQSISSMTSTVGGEEEIPSKLSGIVEHSTNTEEHQYHDQDLSAASSHAHSHSLSGSHSHLPDHASPLVEHRHSDAHGHDHGHSHSMNGSNFPRSHESLRLGTKTSNAYTTPFEGSNGVSLR